MKKLCLFGKINICALLVFFSSLNAYTAVINFSGQLDVILLDGGSGIYSGTPVGTKFSGFIDDVTANGEIRDGTTLTSFGCCIAAGGLSVSNNFVLDTDDAALINTFAGVSMFNAGDLVDLVNIEGDTLTSGGGRIEIGLSYIFDSNTFSDTSLSNYPFDPNDVLLALFFIVEEDAIGEDIYSSAGQLNEMPFPASLWPFETGTVYEYRISDNSGVNWTEIVEVLEEVTLDSKKYHHVRIWENEPGDMDIQERFVRTTDTAIYTWTGNGEEIPFKSGPVGTTWTSGNDVIEIIEPIEVSVPYGGPYTAIVHRKYNYVENSPHRFEYIVPGFGWVKAVDYWSDNPPMVMELTRICHDGAADFTTDTASGSTPLIVNFTDQSCGIITSWSWNFGDGSTSTLQNPSHTYTDPGTYTINLTVVGASGTKTEIKTDYITVENPATPQQIPRYRLYNPFTFHHHYTTNPNEYNALETLGWIQEGAGCYLYNEIVTIDSVNAVPYYRVYNPNSFEHHWTTDANEYNLLGTLGWIQEGADGYVFASQVSGSEPLYRLYNPNDGLHHWTMDSNERDVLIGLGFIDEGIACYVFP